MYVVTLNYNLKTDTIACIESVLADGVAIEHVIVVDNGSTDDSVAALRSRFGHDLTLISTGENLGFGAGMNAGIEYALEKGASWLLLLNNDTLIAPDMVRVLLVEGENHEAAGILGPAIYYFDDPERLWRLGDRRHRWLPMPLTVKMNAVEAGDSPPFQVDYVTGCGMLIRRAVLERVGLFDTRYFMYFEDADLCARARDAGFEVWCVPRAKMWHKVSLTAQREKALNRYHRALNQVRFYHAHPHGPCRALSEAYIAAKAVTTTLGDAVRGDWDLIAPLWRGTWDGYRMLRGGQRPSAPGGDAG